MIKLLTEFTIPMVGKRGGKIPISLNRLNSISPNSKIPSWAIRKRVKDHYLTHCKICYENGILKAREGELRHVMFIRNIPKRGRLIDTDNLAGGLKALRDVLIIRGYIWDDDKAHLKDKYIQRKTNNEVESITIRIGKEDETQEQIDNF